MIKRHKILDKMRTWLLLLFIILLISSALSVTVEIILRISGFGYPAAFFVPSAKPGLLASNQAFSLRFFPKSLMKEPVPAVIPAVKQQNWRRIFILGGSAARGEPDPMYSMGRYLEAMLKVAFPGQGIEVVNTGMTAINSHVVLPIARECVKHGADMLILYMGNNEIVGPYGANGVFQGFSPNLSLIRAGILTRSFKTGQLAEAVYSRLRRRSPAFREWKGMEMFLDSKITRNDPRMQVIYENYRQNLKDICALAHSNGVSIILATIPVNVFRYPPFASLHGTTLSESALQQWQRLFQKGEEAFAQGRNTEALSALLKALNLDFGYAELHYLLGEIYLDSGMTDEAIRHYTAAKEFDALRFRADSSINHIIRRTAAGWGSLVLLADIESRLAELHFRTDVPAGDTLFLDHVHLTLAGNYLAACELFKNASKMFSPDPIAPPSRAACDSFLGVNEADRHKMSRTVIQAMDRPPFSLQRGHASLQKERKRYLKEYAGSINQKNALAELKNKLNTILNRDSLNMEARFKLAGAYLESNDLNRAETELEYILTLMPGNIQAGQMMSKVLSKKSKTDAARAALEKTRRFSPEYLYHYNLSQIYQENKFYPLAEEELRKTLKYHPGFLLAHRQLGNIYKKRNDFTQAEEHFRFWSETEPHSASAWTSLGLVYDKSKKNYKALAAFKKALFLDPGNEYAAVTISTLLMKMGRLNEAESILMNCLDYQPGGFYLHFNLGYVFLYSNELEKAKTHFLKAQALQPGDIQTRKILSQVEMFMEENK